VLNSAGRAHANHVLWEVTVNILAIQVVPGEASLVYVDDRDEPIRAESAKDLGTDDLIAEQLFGMLVDHLKKKAGLI